MLCDGISKRHSTVCCSSKTGLCFAVPNTLAKSWSWSWQRALAYLMTTFSPTHTHTHIHRPPALPCPALPCPALPCPMYDEMPYTIPYRVGTKKVALPGLFFFSLKRVPRICLFYRQCVRNEISVYIYVYIELCTLQ